MPMYVCHVGEAASVARDEPGCFAVTDDRGREWFCRQVPAGDAEFFDASEEAFYFGNLAAKRGFEHGARFVYGAWPDQDALREALKDQ